MGWKFFGMQTKSLWKFLYFYFMQFGKFWCKSRGSKTGKTLSFNFPRMNFKISDLCLQYLNFEQYFLPSDNFSTVSSWNFTLQQVQNSNQSSLVYEFHNSSVKILSKYYFTLKISSTHRKIPQANSNRIRISKQQWERTNSLLLITKVDFIRWSKKYEKKSE